MIVHKHCFVVKHIIGSVIVLTQFCHLHPEGTTPFAHSIRHLDSYPRSIFGHYHISGAIDIGNLHFIAVIAWKVNG